MSVGDRPRLRVFSSSPSDVRPERLVAERLLWRLDREFAHHLRVEPVLWEREPLLAAHPFQDLRNIPPPRSTDIAVVILWSRLGMPLPVGDFRGAVSGKVPVTGTGWEFEDALAACRADGRPDLLVYRKTAPAFAPLDDDAVLDSQWVGRRAVGRFMATWFKDSQGQSFTAVFREFADATAFEELLEANLRALLLRRLEGEAPAAGQPAPKLWHENPFRGVASFEPRHAPIFFGRTRARNELRELLARQAARGTAFVLVLGASGSGKSSLVKAGLLPELMLPGMVGKVALCWYAVFRPGDALGAPLASLAAAILAETALPELAGLRYIPDRLAIRLGVSPDQAVFAVEQGLAAAAGSAGLAARAEARLARVVDQLEELFTDERATPAERAGFVAALSALARPREARALGDLLAPAPLHEALPRPTLAA